eukprot:GFYU01001548.1.p1 GENE.GFYU01001548.1~~GFYU01001548.1.p1  ORF type:complete len:247 (-),score=25.34 GFYU01001548.1:179-919(-)
MAALLRSLITPECYEQFTEDTIFHRPCLQLLLSKTLGYGILVGSSLLKVPQIYTIMKHKSVEGLSFAMFILELAVYTVCLAYNILKQFPISTYGELIPMTVQDIVIVYLLFYYGSTLDGKFYTFAALYFVCSYVLISGLVPMSIVAILNLWTIPVFMSSRVPQIMENYKRKSTGQLSVPTTFLTVAGSAARIFTTLSETGDIIILVSYVCGTLLNLVVFVQIFYYWERHPGRKDSSPMTSKLSKII